MRQTNVRTVLEVQRHYDQANDNYDRVRFGTPGGRCVDKAEQEFVAHFVLGTTVLEVGTATGRFAASLIGRKSEYTGIDLSRAMLRATKNRTDRSANVFQMDACHLAFTGHFDCVLCVRTFHFLPMPLVALQGMLRSLKPLGRCLVTFETDNGFRRLILLLRIGISEQYYYKRAEVLDMMRAAGFNILKSGSVIRLPVTFYRRCPSILLSVLKRLDRFWIWSMHDYVLGSKQFTPESFPN